MKFFISGGSRGIGKAIVRQALKEGHDVAFTYNNLKTDVDSLMEEAKEAGPGQCKAYHLNIGDHNQVSEVVAKVLDDFNDEMDCVVNNAGINKNNLAFNMSNEEWHDVINTNLNGSFYVSREFLPTFLSQKRGRFVSMSSIARDGIAGQVNYSASKAGIVGLACALGKEYGAKGITSNVVVPGFFETDMTNHTMSDQLKKFWLQNCPAKRIGLPEEIAGVVMFLASDASSFVNCQVIPVSGGLDWAP